MSKQRVDVILVERGLFESRSKAAAAVLAGDVQLEHGGRRVDKPGQMLDGEVGLLVAERDRYVSRGGIKLENALEAFPAVEIAGREALDAGASTGGFTDCLLQRGAAHVIAVDVAYGELHMSIRKDPRVTVIERKNIRELNPEELRYAPDLIVADLSFIGLSKVLPALRRIAAEEFDMLALVKPQFEVGRERISKGGVVRDRGTRIDAIAGAARDAVDAGFSVQGACSSGLPGPKGNREAFLWLAEKGRPGVEDLRALAEAVEAVPEDPR
jgi:23S rRNA (cytidine1920-2'-O)/16S rRNA (cytidine1409-2'-O)-methyltransferase